MTATPGITHSTGHVTSADGTVIGFRRIGSGEAVLLLHGNLLTSLDLMPLASALSGEFDLIVPDRRGRGLSGGHGNQYGMDREIEDVRALVQATGATRVFGLSSGALVALRSALVMPQLTQVAVYEPPLSVNGSAPIGWVSRFDREVAHGKWADALLTCLRGLGMPPWFARLPRWLVVPILRGVQASGALDDEIPLKELLPATHYDMQLVAELADTASDFEDLQTEVLLIGGSKSPEYLRTIALDALEAVLPRSSRIEISGLDHTSPAEKRGAPRVASTLLGFFEHRGGPQAE
ncbi:alpha/beta fold hydrolase [Humibacter sp. RRB41]|uniref:alpha/beta fold hydrolase n=1 Tax=Humibacter sp. RRB41 TaxID=2919946 RepID=UPI001FAABC69|nr:alpha/beta hydrolase [Humibacter sp. RRB41]